MPRKTKSKPAQPTAAQWNQRANCRRVRRTEQTNQLRPLFRHAKLRELTRLVPRPEESEMWFPA
jgi:hypothetical protein